MVYEPTCGRIEAMRLLLLWEGRLKRSRLMLLFNLKQTRASQWINEFNKTHPEWSKWSDLTSAHHVTDKAYRDATKLISSDFTINASLERYLSITSSLTNSNIEREDGLIWSAFPDFSAPKAKIFAQLYGAILDKQSVKTLYRSLSTPEPHIRTLSPHSLVRAGKRWHVRAYCEETHDFRDYALGRFTSIQAHGQPGLKIAEDDLDWKTRINIEIIAHPGLTEPQQRMIRDEYFLGEASRVEPCRGCLVPYFIKDINATLNPKQEHAPAWLLAIANPKIVAPWLIQ